MAILSTIICERCGKNSEESHGASFPPPEMCTDCKRKEKEKACEDYMVSRREKSLVKRVEELELEVYELKQRKPGSHWDDLIG